MFNATIGIVVRVVPGVVLVAHFDVCPGVGADSEDWVSLGFCGNQDHESQKNLHFAVLLDIGEGVKEMGDLVGREV